MEEVPDYLAEWLQRRGRPEAAGFAAQSGECLRKPSPICPQGCDLLFGHPIVRPVPVRAEKKKKKKKKKK